MSCSATKRISIRWPPADAYEDTDTLVLSVNEYFVDVRVKKDHQTIDWAFAGTKSVSADGKHVWQHAIDSRGSKEEDSGFITLLDNGDELEFGSMRNPDTDTIMEHEEIWRAVPLLSDEGYISVSKIGDTFAAYVDTHFLIVKVVRDVTSVARFGRTANEATWEKVFVVDSDSMLRAVDSPWIEALRGNPEWNILTSANM